MCYYKLSMEKGNSGNELVKAFQNCDKSVFFQLLENFPYAIEIFAPDGTAVYINQVCCEQYNIADRSQIVGRYNILADPVTNDVLGLREEIKRVFNGEKRTAYDVRLPFEDTDTRYDKKTDDFYKALYMDITGLPLKNKKGKVIYVVMIFVAKQTYKGKKEIIQVQEYINNNWRESYDIEKIARKVNLSSFHLTRLFKQFTGKTVFDYYKSVKIKNIKEKLLDPNLNIKESFAECGVEYGGRWAKTFKDFVGCSPQDYQKQKMKTK